MRSVLLEAKRIGKGLLVEAYGYERDDIAARFFLRDLEPGTVPPQGVWRRYDLDRVRLARPRFVLDLPAGAAVEFAYAGSLSRGRVPPWITLSAGPSANLDRFAARGGEQEFSPLEPRGGRFVEVHVLADPGKTRFLREEFLERTYHRDPLGSWPAATPSSRGSGGPASRPTAPVRRTPSSTIPRGSGASGRATSWRSSLTSSSAPPACDGI